MVSRAKVVPKRIFDSPPLLCEVFQGDVLNLKGNELATYVEAGGVPYISHTKPLEEFSCGFALTSGQVGDIIPIVPWDNEIRWYV